MSTIPFHSIAGIDEAGRGPLAGPVVAAACMLPKRLHRSKKGGWEIRGQHVRVYDSKHLSESARTQAFAWITAHCTVGIGIIDAQTIDHMGIKAATHLAMKDALKQLQSRAQPALLYVDGCDGFSFDLPSKDCIRGDALHACIAAASIVAKVTRDTLMCRAATQYPAYGFAAHKGYGTAQHRQALRLHGPCALHRISFLSRVCAPTEANQSDTEEL